MEISARIFRNTTNEPSMLGQRTWPKHKLQKTKRSRRSQHGLSQASDRGIRRSAGSVLSPIGLEKGADMTPSVRRRAYRGRNHK